MTATGKREGEGRAKCRSCGGKSGRYIHHAHVGYDIAVSPGFVWEPCNSCGGTGYVYGPSTTQGEGE